MQRCIISEVHDYEHNYNCGNLCRQMCRTIINVIHSALFIAINKSWSTNANYLDNYEYLVMQTQIETVTLPLSFSLTHRIYPNTDYVIVNFSLSQIRITTLMIPHTKFYFVTCNTKRILIKCISCLKLFLREKEKENKFCNI